MKSLQHWNVYNNNNNDNIQKPGFRTTRSTSLSKNNVFEIINVWISTSISVLESFKKRGACLDKKNEAMCIDLQEGIFCSSDFLHKIDFVWFTNILSFSWNEKRFVWFEVLVGFSI